MALEWIRFGICAFFVTVGVAAMIAAVAGVYRFKDPLCKMHAAAMIDTLAFSSFILAALVGYGAWPENLKGLLAIGFLWLTSPVNSHLLARLETMTGERRGQSAPVLPEEGSEEKEE